MTWIYDNLWNQFADRIWISIWLAGTIPSIPHTWRPLRTPRRTARDLTEEQKSQRWAKESRKGDRVFYSWWYSIEKWWSGEPIVNIDIICSSTESYSSCVFVWDFKSRHLEVPQIQSRFGQMCRLLGRAVQHMVLRCAQDSIWIDNFDICLLVR